VKSLFAFFAITILFVTGCAAPTAIPPSHPETILTPVQENVLRMAAGGSFRGIWYDGAALEADVTISLPTNFTFAANGGGQNISLVTKRTIWGDQKPVEVLSPKVVSMRTVGDLVMFVFTGTEGRSYTVTLRPNGDDVHVTVGAWNPNAPSHWGVNDFSVETKRVT